MRALALRSAHFFALLLSLSMVPRLDAQSVARGDLQGTVLDQDARPVFDATVRLIDRAGGELRTVATPRDGSFRFALLSPGTYDVAIEALGFRPVRVVGVELTAGGAVPLRVALRRAAPPVVAIDTVRAAVSRVRPLSWLTERGYAELTGGRRLGSDAATLSTTSDEGSIEGLPWRFADLMIDGLRAGSVGAPSADGSVPGTLALPSRAAAIMRAEGTGFDAEVGGSGVGIVARTRAGAGLTSIPATVYGGTSDLGGGVTFAGPIQRDTAYAIAGVDFQRSEVERPALFGPDDIAGRALIGVARDSFATDLGSYGLANKRLEERASGFARLDWQVADRYAITVRASGSRVITQDPPSLGGAALALGSRHEATGAQLAVDVSTRLTSRLTSELRIGGDVGRARADGPALPSTSFAGRGIRIGGATDEPFDDRRVTPRLAAILHWDLGAHRIKAGATIASHRLESSASTSTTGAFAFGDSTDLAGANGAWRGVSSAASSGSYRMNESAFFLQDAWRVGDGFALTLGVRFDGLRVPASDIQPNSAFAQQAGLDNTAVREKWARVSPRIGFRWELGADRAWLLEGGAGIYHDLPDRRDIGDALALDQGVAVRSAFGSLGGWPAAPSGAIAPDRGNTIVLLGPGLEGPRTRRASVSVQRQSGVWTTFMQGTYRQTDFLSRRRDLNLPVGATGLDQNGRPLFGTLAQAGTLVGVVPGSNRRFAGFESVQAIEVTGFSEFSGVTLGIERAVESGMSLGAHYTYSSTTDNLSGGLDAIGALGVGGSGRDWEEGTANTDAPHRVLAAMEWAAGTSGGLRLGVIYRGRSGAPFTPGFRAGVDMNGDGIVGNDPAFIDPAAPGMNALIAANDCLPTTASFAVRNSCRGEWINRIDVRVTLRLARLASGPIDLVLDALDVTAVEAGPIDGALYLVDRTGSVTTAPATGVTTVPLIVNPGFGTYLADRSPGPLFRVGLRIGR